MHSRNTAYFYVTAVLRKRSFVVSEMLKRNAYHPFFDEYPDCLPKGEPFAQRIKDTCRLADVGVVVLSDEFLQSKCPMIELTIFIQEQEERSRMSVGECK